MFSYVLHKYRLLVFGGLLFVIMPAALLAQDPVKWELRSAAQNTELKKGEKFAATLGATIEGNWYLYALDQPEGGPIATTVKLPEGSKFALAGEVGSTKPVQKYDPNFEIETRFFSDRAAFEVPLRAEETADAGELALDVRYQVCDDKICLPPKTVRVTFDGATDVRRGTLMSGRDLSPPDTADAGTVKDFQSDTRREESIWAFIWLAVTFGLISLLTPCVFPMIPITVSYFMKHSDGDHKKAVKLATVYSVGIIATFSLLGMLLAVFLGAAGINLFAANPWVNLFIAAIFIFFAFNLFGFYEISIPAPVLSKLDRLARTEEGKGSAYIGALLMGLTFTLTSFTCTSPFIGTILVSTSQGDWRMPLLGMLAFSAVFALPFFVLALVPRLLHSLPRSGGWLNSVKVVMGFLEIAAAMKFISNVDLVWGAGADRGVLNYGWIFSREIVLAIWVVIGLAIAAYILGLFRFRHDAPVRRITPLRVVFATLFLVLSVYLTTGILGRKLGELESFLPPKNAESRLNVLGDRDADLKFIKNDFKKALETARAENKRVFVDFTGYTCTNCRWMEANMFTRPEVRREMEQFVLVSLYTDGDGEIYQRQQQFQEETFKTVALPFYAVFDANGQPLATFPGLTRDPQEFLDFLRRSR